MHRLTSLKFTLYLNYEMGTKRGFCDVKEMITIETEVTYTCKILLLLHPAFICIMLTM